MQVQDRRHDGLPPFERNEVRELPDGRRVIRMRDRDVVVRLRGNRVEFERGEDYVFLQERKASLEALLGEETWQGRKDILTSFYAVAAPSAGMKVLDVGFRDYRNLRWLRDTYGVEPWGVDIAAPAVDLARREGFKVARCDIQSETPFAGAAFDCIVCIDVLEHLRDPLAGLRNMRRALRRDGRLVLQTIVEGRFGDNLVHGHCTLFHTPHYVCVLLRRAGFGSAEVVATGGDHMFTVRTVAPAMAWPWRVTPDAIAVRVERVLTRPGRKTGGSRPVIRELRAET